MLWLLLPISILLMGWAVRYRFHEWKDNVEAPRRQIEIQHVRRRRTAARLADALGERLDADARAALRGERGLAALTEALAVLPEQSADDPPPLRSLRTDLSDITHRLRAAERIHTAERAVWTKRAPDWLARLVFVDPPALPHTEPPAAPRA